MLVQPHIFARLVAHDLRSPITTAAEALALSETVAPAVAEELRDIARMNLCRAEKMVTGLRSFVRAEGEPEFIERLDVREVVVEVMEGIEHTMEGRHTKAALVGDLGNLFACRARISHVFHNLMVNAIVHNKGIGGLEIEVGRKDAEHVSFYVRDNGRGIAAKDHTAIFEPFKSVKKDWGEGMGLGLSLVGSIVGQIGGDVWVESEIGRGATFWFSWPMPDYARKAMLAPRTVAPDLRG